MELQQFREQAMEFMDKMVLRVLMGYQVGTVILLTTSILQKNIGGD